LINDNKTWVTLINGLTAATRVGRLKWSEKDNKTHRNLQSAVASALASNRPKVFSAQTKSTAYELSSTDFFAKAPYHLEVWEMQGLKQVPLGSVRSSAVVDSESMDLNKALETLFGVVDQTTESGEQIVSRLLGEL
jgi:hypothetical protein